MVLKLKDIIDRFYYGMEGMGRTMRNTILTLTKKKSKKVERHGLKPEDITIDKIFYGVSESDGKLQYVITELNDGTANIIVE